jgi:hypothetical protein
MKHCWGYLFPGGEKNSLLLRPNCVNTLGKLLRLVEIRQLALHPDQIRVRRVRNSSRDSGLAAAAQTVVALASPGRVPVEMNVNASETLGDCTSFHVALAGRELVELGDHGGFVDVDAGVDGVCDGFVEEFERSLLVPGVFDGLQLGTGFAGCFGVEHEVVEGLESGVGGAENVGVVAGVDCAGDEGGGFGVCAGDGEEVGAWWGEGRLVAS